MSSAQLRGRCCFVQVTYDAQSHKLRDGQPLLQGIHQLAAFSAMGFLPPITCRCGVAALYQGSSLTTSNAENTRLIEPLSMADHTAHGEREGHSWGNAAEWLTAGSRPSDMCAAQALVIVRGRVHIAL